MARKSMPATRKRRSPTREELRVEMPASPLQEQQKVASAAAPPSLPPAHITSHLDRRAPAHPPSSQPLRAHGKRRRAPGDIQNLRKRLHACKHEQQVPPVRNRILSKQLEEACKVLNMASTFQNVSALESSYESDCKLLSGAKKFASIPDLIGSVINLRTWMDILWPSVNAEYCVGHCLDDVQRMNAIGRGTDFNKQNIMGPKTLTDVKEFLMLTPQREIIGTLLSQHLNELEEKCKFCMTLRGQYPAISTLLNESLCQLVPTCERKTTWVGDAPMKAVNLNCSDRKRAFVGREEYSTKANKHDKAQTRNGLPVDGEKPADADLWISHQMSYGELESWIVKHSMPPKQRRHEVMEKPKQNFEKSEIDCSENGMDSHIEIEVELSRKSGSLFVNEAAATDSISNMACVKHILKTISLSRVNLDGQDEVQVLFIALRSDGKEIIVDNAYLRSTYPLLLACELL